MAKTIQGRAVVNTKAEVTVLFSDPTPQFIYSHHGNMWDLVETNGIYELLPHLIEFMYVPGVNGIKKRANGGVNATNEKARRTEEGWVFIDQKAAGADGYLREFDGHRGKIYKSKWCTPRRLGGGARARIIWDHDTNGYNDWRRSLVENGTIEKPDPTIIDMKIELLTKRIERKAKFSHNPDVLSTVEKYRMQVASLQALKNPEPTKKRTTRSKTNA
jgi:hypothetical protein